jgi:hypothetical protein
MFKGQIEITMRDGTNWKRLMGVYNTGYIVGVNGVGTYKESGNHVIFNEAITENDDVYVSSFFNFDNGESEVLISGLDYQNLFTSGNVTLTVNKPRQVIFKTFGVRFDSDYTYEQSRTQDPQEPYDTYIAIQTVDTVPMLFGDTSNTERMKLATNGYVISEQDTYSTPVNFAHSDHWRSISLN